MKKRFIAIMLAIVVLASACSNGTNSQEAEAQIAREQQLSAEIATRYSETQPVPVFDWSQQRQNLIELLTAQAETTATTTFFLNMGGTQPIGQCPSIGFSIPATYQLTNPWQPVEVDVWGDNAAVAVNQLEATGVYTADTTGTYTICTSDSGQAYAVYWEGFVMTVSGSAEWRDGQAVLIGESSFDFSEGR